MSASTLEQAKAICARNARGRPYSSKRAGPLRWSRETAHTIVTECHTYRISKRTEEGSNPPTFGYFLELCATQTSAPRHISGPFFTAKAAREAAQAHSQGEPLQADLA